MDSRLDCALDGGFEGTRDGGLTSGFGALNG